MARKHKISSNKKQIIRDCHRLQGTLQQFTEARTAAVGRGLKGDKAWYAAMQAVPIEEAVRKKVVQARLRRDPLPKPGDLVPDLPLLEQANWTGVEPIDWIMSNLELRADGKLTRPAKGNEDMALLKYYRAHKDEFMKILYCPALLKKMAARPVEPLDVEDLEEKEANRKHDEWLLNQM